MKVILSIVRRIGLKFFAWFLADVEDTKFHAINSEIYRRCLSGKSLVISFSHPQIEVGEATYGLRPECFKSYHPDDRVVIGKYCSIAEGVKFVFGDHSTDRVSTFPFRAMLLGEAPHQDAISSGPIVIGNDVWIGANAIILSGVEVGDGAVVAAGSIVTKNVSPYAIVGGNPAKLIRYRLDPDQVKQLLEIQWWDWGEAKIKRNGFRFYGDVSSFIQEHV